jgi:FkbM family methyltransferase
MRWTYISKRLLAVLDNYGLSRSLIYLLKLGLATKFYRRKRTLFFANPVWREINFKSLGLKGDAKLLLNPQDEGFSKEFFQYGFREPLNTFTIYNFVRAKRPFILDIGSNLGYFPLIELQAGAKHVVCIEPVPESIEFLRKSLESFHNVTILEMAIAEKTSEEKFYIAKEKNVSSFFKNTSTKIVKEIVVKTSTLSSIAELYPFNMIRMDIEGYEHRILTGKIPDNLEAISVEFHVMPPFNKMVAVNTLKALADNGFNCSVVINELNHGYYPIVNYLGLKVTYKIALLIETPPPIRINMEMCELQNEIKEFYFLHLLLER